MTTVHAYTNDQRILDLPHEDLRRARAAALSMIPTSTGAAKAIGLVIPELDGKLDGMAVRVPTPNVSLVDLTCELEQADHQGRHQRRDAGGGAERPAEGHPLLQRRAARLERLQRHSPYSSIFDAELTQVIDGNFVKVLSWYDNEWGFSNRMRDVALLIGKSL